MKTFTLLIAEIILWPLLLFGLLCTVLSVLDAEMGIAGIIIFGIWSIVSLLLLLKIHKKRVFLKQQKYDAARTNIPVEIPSVHSDKDAPSRYSEPVEQSEDILPAETEVEKDDEEVETTPFVKTIQRYLTTDHSTVPFDCNPWEYYYAEFDCVLNGIPQYPIELRNESVLRKTGDTTPYTHSSTFTKRTNREKVSNFVVVDVETTGLRPDTNDIVEVSAVKFENFVPVSAFTTLLKPRGSIPADAYRINGISDAMVADAPSFSQIKRSLETFIGNNPIVAHNASFDIKFLHTSGLDFPEEIIVYDTLSLSRKHIRNRRTQEKLTSYKLAIVCADRNIFFKGAHRSFADALATGLLFVEIVKVIFEVDSVKDILVKAITVTCSNPQAQVDDFSIGSRVDISHDSETGKLLLTINQKPVCLAPKALRDLLNNKINQYDLSVLDVLTGDAGKIKIKIGLYES